MLKLLNTYRKCIINKNIHPALCYSSNAPEKGFNSKPNVSEIKADYIGPPDESSNIRPILRHTPENETHLQKKLRLKRIDAEQFVSGFWRNHNKRFIKEKNEFIAERQKDKELNADEMSEFYKKFLDKKLGIAFLFQYYVVYEEF